VPAPATPAPADVIDPAEPPLPGDTLPETTEVQPVPPAPVPPVTVPPATDTPAPTDTADVPPAAPVAPEPAPAAGMIGTFVSEEQLMVRWDEGTGQWLRLTKS